MAKERSNLAWQIVTVALVLALGTGGLLLYLDNDSFRISLNTGENLASYEKGILKRHIPDTSPQSLKDLFRSLAMDQDPILSDLPQ